MTPGTPIDFLATGTLFFDLVFRDAPMPGPGEETFAREFAVSPGGAANKAVASARLGRATTLLSEIGDDWAGRLVLETLGREAHLDLSRVAHRPGMQTAVTASVTNDLDRSFITYAEPFRLPHPGADLPRVGVLDIDASRPLPDWARALRTQGTRLFAGAAWDPSGRWDPALLDNLTEIDVFVLNEIEALSYARRDDIDEAARLIGASVPTVVVTLGPGGSLSYTRERDELVRAPGIGVRATDPTGAGDTFTAAFAASYDLDWPMRDRLRLANLAAALSVQGLGGARSAPDTARLIDFLDTSRDALPDLDEAGNASPRGSDRPLSSRTTRKTMRLHHEKTPFPRSRRDDRGSQHAPPRRLRSGGSGPSASSSLGPVSKDVAGAGNVTLTVWDVNSDGSGNDVQEALNQSFMAKYPNVTVKRVARAFSDAKTTLGLALNSSDAPDVAQVNQTYGDMGTFVGAGLLRPMNDYADLYGWKDSIPAGQLSYNSYSSDGKHWQTGDLYGISQTGEIVGVYYNKKLLNQVGVTTPKTISDFNNALPKIAAAGVLPIAFGNSEAWPALHEFGTVQAAVMGTPAVRGSSPAPADRGPTPPTSRCDDAADLGAEELPHARQRRRRAGCRTLDLPRRGLCLLHLRTWNAADVQSGLGQDAGFLVLTPDNSTTPSSPGGIGLAFGISSASKHPDVAAAYIDWVTNAAAADKWLASARSPPSCRPRTRPRPVCSPTSSRTGER